MQSLKFSLAIADVLCTMWTVGYAKVKPINKEIGMYWDDMTHENAQWLIERGYGAWIYDCTPGEIREYCRTELAKAVRS